MQKAILRHELGPIHCTLKHLGGSRQQIGELIEKLIRWGWDTEVPEKALVYLSSCHTNVIILLWTIYHGGDGDVKLTEKLKYLKEKGVGNIDFTDVDIDMTAVVHQIMDRVRLVRQRLATYLYGIIEERTHTKHILTAANVINAIIGDLWNTEKHLTEMLKEIQGGESEHKEAKEE